MKEAARFCAKATADLDTVSIVNVAESLKSGKPLSQSLSAVRTSLLPFVAEHGVDVVVGMLLGGLAARDRARAEQQIDVVWTGPASGQNDYAMTAQVLVDLIDSAVKEILLVSFSTSPSPAVLEALSRAAARGVEIVSLLERSVDNPSYHGHPPKLPGSQWAWPLSQREPGAAMHAKIVVVDRRAALVGSANLSGAAASKNLECGVKIVGGSLPADVVQHVFGLLAAGVLTVVGGVP